MLADRYRLDAPLGRGGMGEVWRAWDLRLGRPVAVKVLAGSAEDAVARFQHEARIAARLSHPHVVGVYDAGTEGGRSFLVMELVAGRSLAQELREEGPLPPARVAEVAAHTAAGLAAAHLRGVVHRDIKPSNLLAGADGSVKIADFGIARGVNGETTAAVTSPGAVLGTSFYLSPEAAAGGRAGSAADVYGLGCTLYELLTGQPPFTGEHPVVVLRRHVEDAPVPPRRLRPQTPGELNAYLLRMLAKQPDLRPTAAEAAAWFAEDIWQGELPGGAEDFDAAEPAFHGSLAAGAGAGATAPERTRARRRAPAAGAITAAAAIAAAALALASPVADGNSPAAPSRTVPSHAVSSQGARGTAQSGAAPAAAGPAPAAPAAANRPQAAATGPASPKQTTGTMPTAPTATPTSSHSTSPRGLPSRSTPVSVPPASAPSAATPPPTPTGGATAPTTDPTTDPTPATPPPTTPDTTPPADGR
ncbi:serine/threonine-protein kinase [Actinacidiphila acididurans]|nr:serine/threonine-protein kinase [Actinacidiphila acididurans]